MLRRHRAEDPAEGAAEPVLVQPKKTVQEKVVRMRRRQRTEVGVDAVANLVCRSQARERQYRTSKSRNGDIP